MFTGCSALALASRNIAARYACNLSADCIFRHSLSRVHGKHLSPRRASIAMTGATLVWLIVVVVAVDIDETLLYGRLAGLYSYTFLILLLWSHSRSPGISCGTVRSAKALCPRRLQPPRRSASGSSSTSPR